jgi:hypothetical protein
MTVTCKEHSGVCQMIDDLRRDTESQWDEIGKIRSRPPIWCTAVIALLSGLLGSTLTYAALIVQASN